MNSRGHLKQYCQAEHSSVWVRSQCGTAALQGTHPLCAKEHPVPILPQLHSLLPQEGTCNELRIGTERGRHPSNLPKDPRIHSKTLVQSASSCKYQNEYLTVLQQGSALGVQNDPPLLCKQLGSTKSQCLGSSRQTGCVQHTQHSIPGFPAPGSGRAGL